MSSDTKHKSEMEGWESHPGADEIRAAMKAILQLQQDILELGDPRYLSALVEITSWMSLLLADDVNCWVMTRIHRDYLSFKLSIPKRRRKSKARHGPRRISVR
jgi:hypothetical protein